ncbi:unnamed protein product [Closterium sp. Naga37s-1]|nr:unnamed protein product [Closterium sp. Naga37s-1]
MPAVNCNIQGGVVDIFLKQRLMRGTMHPDISNFTALTALSVPSPPCRDMSSNFLSGRLDPFITPLTGLTALKNLVMSYIELIFEAPKKSPPSPPPVCRGAGFHLSFDAVSALSLSPATTLSKFPALALPSACPLSVGWNYQTWSVPVLDTALQVFQQSQKLCVHVCVCVCACASRSVGWNYLTGSVPVLGTSTLQVLDLENNWFVGKYPSTANWYFCTARANCFNDPTPCKNNNNQGITQRPSCAICNSADGTASALMNIKTALGVTYTNWASSSSCTAVGSSGGGGFTGVECDSLGNPVKITLDSQKLSGILHADITKLTALTFMCQGGKEVAYGANVALRACCSSLKSNLFKARLDEFSSRIPFESLRMPCPSFLSLPPLPPVWHCVSLKSNLFRARLYEFSIRIPTLPNLAVL